MSARLAIVPEAPRSAKDLLAEMVPELIAAEETTARLRTLVAEQTKALAKERRVAFIRPEQIRREFGGR